MQFKNRNSKFHCLVLILLVAGVSACAAPGYYMQRGALIGAGAGALVGQAVGRNTSATLLGAGAGSVAGGLAGFICDQIVPRSRYQPQPAGYDYQYDGRASYQEFSIPPREQDAGPATQENMVCPHDDSW